MFTKPKYTWAMKVTRPEGWTDEEWDAFVREIQEIEDDKRRAA